MKETDLVGGQDFYELMQAYRHAPATDQSRVVVAFEAVKAYISNELLRQDAKTIVDKLHRIRVEGAGTASISKDDIPVRHTYRKDMGNFLTVDCPEGWDDVKKLTKKVLIHNGVKYTFTGWNSDRNECFFKENKSFAKAV